VEFVADKVAMGQAFPEYCGYLDTVISTLLRIRSANY
jgi:hypothetical protein